jgi:hypothetical protein
VLLWLERFVLLLLTDAGDRDRLAGSSFPRATTESTTGGRHLICCMIPIFRLQTFLREKKKKHRLRDDGFERKFM